MGLKLLILVCLIINQVINTNAQERIVDTNVGQIRGYRANNDGNYYEFLGIPFGRLDPENLFSAAVPVPNFEGIYNATDRTIRCAQQNGGVIDCLHLFIYTPEHANATSNFPVIVFIHGGGWSGGSGNNVGPRFLMNHDVIFVSINYRVHTYGFMCVDIPEVAGNQAFKDQVLALRWIQNNIEFFGGDKDRITLSGQSAGAMSIDLHFMSDIDVPFNRAIVMSGTSYTPFLAREPNNTVPIEVARRLGFNTTDPLEALRYLSTLPPPTVISNSEAVFEQRPCKENSYDGVESYMSEFPANVHELRNVSGKSFMVGFTDDEQLIYTYPLSNESLRNMNLFEEQINRAFRFDPETYNEAIIALKNFYIGGANYSRDAVFGMTDFFSDIRHNYPTHRTMRRLLANGAEKVYYYVFSYIGGRNFVRNMYGLQVGGAVHSDDLSYVFGYDYNSGTAEDFDILEKLVTMWVNFATYGDPTPQVTELLPTKWEPVTANSLVHYMRIDRNLPMDISPFQQRFAFWDLFFSRYGEYEWGYARENTNNAPLLSSTIFLILLSVFTALGF